MKKKKRSTKGGASMLSSEEFDQKFESGESVMKYVDLDSSIFRVNVDFPAWAVSELDRESQRLGISRQALIKVWVTERLDQLGRDRHKKVI